TCAALGLMAGYFKEEVLSQIDGEILQETAKTCNLAQQNSTVKSQVIAQAKNLEANRNKTPAVVLNPQTTTVPPTTSVVVKPATPVDVPTTAPVPTPVVIEQTQMTPEPTPIEFPEMTVEARPEDKSYGSATPWLIGLAVVGGAAYLILRKKKECSTRSRVSLVRAVMGEESSKRPSTGLDTSTRSRVSLDRAAMGEVSSKRLLMDSGRHRLLAFLLFSWKRMQFFRN